MNKVIGFFHSVDELKDWADAQAKAKRFGGDGLLSRGFTQAMREMAESPDQEAAVLQSWAAGRAEIASSDYVTSGDLERLGFSMGMRDIAGSVIDPNVEIPAYQRAFMEEQVPV